MTNPDRTGTGYVGTEHAQQPTSYRAGEQFLKETFNGAQISALQKQVMERLHAMNLDIELRKLALKSAMEIMPATYNHETILEYARVIHAFLSEPAAEIKLNVTRQD